MREKRRDNRNRILLEGEYQRADGRYRYRHIDKNGKENNVYGQPLAKSGMNPKMLQYIMGHSDISVTMNTYTHVQFDDAKTEMLRVVGRQAVGKLLILTKVFTNEK